MNAPTRLLERIEAYYDAAPRTGADSEQVGPFTLFVGRGGWRYYARPTLGTTVSFTPAHVASVRARQRELGVEEQIEWQPTVTPSLRAACAQSGMVTHDYRLMVHDASAPTAVSEPMRLVEQNLQAALSAQQQGFGAPAQVSPDDVRLLSDRVAQGLTVVVAAFVHEQPVCVGMHQPLGEVSEVVGVATLPSHRRQGWAGAVTDALVADALARGVATVFLSAADESVARVYRRVGFRDVGTACAAEPAPRPS